MANFSPINMFNLKNRSSRLKGKERYCKVHASYWGQEFPRCVAAQSHLKNGEEVEKCQAE